MAIVTDSKDSTEKQKQDSESSRQDQAKLSQKPAKKRNRIPVFNEDDLYKVKYDF